MYRRNVMIIIEPSIHAVRFRNRRARPNCSIAPLSAREHGGRLEADRASLHTCDVAQAVVTKRPRLSYSQHRTRASIVGTRDPLLNALLRISALHDATISRHEQRRLRCARETRSWPFGVRPWPPLASDRRSAISTPRSLSTSTHGAAVARPLEADVECARLQRQPHNRSLSARRRRVQGVRPRRVRIFRPERLGATTAART